jgi:hypothetical protein
MKPIIYVLELCDTTGEHRPVAVMHASTPFPPVSVGELPPVSTGQLA